MTHAKSCFGLAVDCVSDHIGRAPKWQIAAIRPLWNNPIRRRSPLPHSAGANSATQVCGAAASSDTATYSTDGFWNGGLVTTKP